MEIERCLKCGKHLLPGMEAHKVDDALYCCKVCAVDDLTEQIINSAKEMALEAYNNDATVFTVTVDTRKPVNEHSEAMCAACDTDLATCSTIYAAEGILYCSKECGREDWQHAKSELNFDDIVEEVQPQDIGIEPVVGLKKAQILEIIETLAKSNGYYSGLLATMNSAAPNERESFLEVLEAHQFRDAIDLIHHLEE